MNKEINFEFSFTTDIEVAFKWLCTNKRLTIFSNCVHNEIITEDGLIFMTKEKKIIWS